MSKPIVFDIETSNTYGEAGAYDPNLLQVSLVGVYDYADGKYFCFLEKDLPELWRRFEKASLLIGFNIEHFDLPVLNRYYTGDLLNLPCLDLLSVVKDALGRRLKLDDLAKATLGYGKTGDGLEATKMWKEGRVEEVKKYCLNDVKITKEIYEYGKEHKFLKYPTPTGTNEIKITFPVQQDIKKINFTLPI